MAVGKRRQVRVVACNVTKLCRVCFCSALVFKDPSSTYNYIFTAAHNTVQSRPFLSVNGHAKFQTGFMSLKSPSSSVVLIGHDALPLIPLPIHCNCCWWVTPVTAIAAAAVVLTTAVEPLQYDHRKHREKHRSV